MILHLFLMISTSVVASKVKRSALFNQSALFPTVPKYVDFDQPASLEVLREEVDSLFQFVGSVTAAYVKTKGAVKASDPFALTCDDNGGKTASFWINNHYWLTEFKREIPNRLEPFIAFYWMATCLGTRYSVNRHTSQPTASVELHFGRHLNLDTLTMETLEEHVREKMTTLSELRENDFRFLGSVRCHGRVFAKALNLLRLAMKVIAPTALDLNLLKLACSIKEISIGVVDLVSPFATFFMPLTMKTRILHEILLKGKTDVMDRMKFGGYLAHTPVPWQEYVDKPLLQSIQQHFIEPYALACRQADSNASDLIREEREHKERKSRLFLEQAKVRIFIPEVEEADEGEEVPCSSGSSQAVRVSDALGFTVKICLAQYYLESYLLPLLDATKPLSDEDDWNNSFAWVDFVSDPAIIEVAAKEPFLLNSYKLSEMASLVTERNELVHRRPYPRELKLRTNWSALFGIYSRDAKEIADYVGINITTDDSVIRHIPSCISTTFAERTYVMLGLLLACETLGYPDRIKDQCTRLSEYRNGYAHPNVNKVRPFIASLIEMLRL